MSLNLFGAGSGTHDLKRVIPGAKRKDIALTYELSSRILGRCVCCAPAKNDGSLLLFSGTSSVVRVGIDRRSGSEVAIKVRAVDPART